MASPAPGTAPTVSSPPAAAQAVEPVDAPITAIPTEPLPKDGTMEADNDLNSAYGSSVASSTASVTSAIRRGYVENGRRYSVSDNNYYMPSDKGQWDSMNALHMTLLVLDSQEANPLFRSPIAESAQHILDIGTGDGSWAVAVGDRLPSVTIHAVDLYPPPQTWVSPNVIFEVDDITKQWLWKDKFDLVHMRWLLGSFVPGDWAKVYAQAYENLVPGGWIEHVEPSVIHRCDDGTLPPDSELANWGQKFEAFGEIIDRPFNVFNTMRASIEAAGFTNIHEKVYKVPIGDWPKHKLYKDAGRFNEEGFREGMEGFAMMLFTSVGEKPWSAEEVQMYLAKLRNELDNRGWHQYILQRRVWAQKPFEKASLEGTETAA